MGPEVVPDSFADAFSAPEPPEAHNTSIDEDLLRAGACARVHLPTGRACTLRHGHAGSCEFVQPGQAAATLLRHQQGEGWGPVKTSMVALGGVLAAVGAVVGGVVVARRSKEDRTG